MGHYHDDDDDDNDIFKKNIFWSNATLKLDVKWQQIKIHKWKRLARELQIIQSVSRAKSLFLGTGMCNILSTGFFFPSYIMKFLNMELKYISAVNTFWCCFILNLHS